MFGKRSDGKKVKDLQIQEKAISYFKGEGGIFTFITGRMPFFVSYIYDAIEPNGPFGCINGGGLFDYQKQEYIWTSSMPKEVTELIRTVDETLPGIGIQVNTFYKVYFAKENETMKHFRAATNLPNLVKHYDDIQEPVAKIVFGSEKDEEIMALEQTLRNHPLSGNFDFIRSERTLFEILPKGIGKGTIIAKLAEYLNLDMNKTIAIGDYNNDISMLRAAKLGIAVANACPEALAAADCVTVSNDEHAVAKVIYDLRDGIYRL